jgi:UDP-N-acetylmuramoyl-L-alanyl-D-glutamate--2,6-diaminopimelate ligase
MQIIYQIETGAKKVNSKYVLIEDRKEAIRYALSIAKDNDVVLIAGKGSEKYQEVLGVKKMFSDKETTLKLIKEFNDL